MVKDFFEKSIKVKCSFVYATAQIKEHFTEKE